MISDFSKKRAIRFPAEWECQQGVLVSLPDASMDWSYMLPEIHDCYRNIIRALTMYGNNVQLLCQDSVEAEKAVGCDLWRQVTPVVLPLNDTWVRDYGPISVVERSCTTDRNRLAGYDFGFNGWGLKFASDKDNLVNRKLDFNGELFGLRYRNCRSFVLEGGSVESDGKGTLLTTSRCLCSPNRNGGLSKAEASEFLRYYLGVEHVLWLDYGALEGDDTDSHIDTLARLCPDDTIIYTGCEDIDDPQFDELQAMKQQLIKFRTAAGGPYNLVELPLPDAIYDTDDGHRLPATYCNYLVTDRVVLVPSYRQTHKDELARKLVKIAYPDREVVSIDSMALIRQHGSLHCATMQIPSPSVIDLNL